MWHQGEQRPLSLFWALSPQSQQTGTISKIPSTWLTLFDPPWMTRLADRQRLHPTELTDPPKLLFHVNGWSRLKLCNFLNPTKQAAAGFSEPQARKGQPRFTAWLCLEIPKPSTSSSYLRFLYNSGRVAPGKTQVVADLGLQHLGNPRASALSEELETTPPPLALHS